MKAHGYTYVHPFDDIQLITGQGTFGLEVYDAFPEVEVVIVPIGGGGLISGVAMAMKGPNPNIRVIGVESSGAPGMLDSIAAGELVTLKEIDCIIDGLRVMRVGEKTFRIVQKYVDEVVALPDREISEAMRWTMGAMKIVPEGAAAAPIAAPFAHLVRAEPGTKVACVLSSGNLNLDQLRGPRWN